MITAERLEELDRDWDECGTWTDEEYRDWYEGLTSEEQAQIDKWDRQYSKAVVQLCEKILAQSEKTAHNE